MELKYKTVITKIGAEKIAAATVPGGKKLTLPQWQLVMVVECCQSQMLTRLS